MKQLLQVNAILEQKKDYNMLNSKTKGELIILFVLVTGTILLVSKMWNRLRRGGKFIT